MIRFDNSGDEGVRVVPLDAAHPTDVEPSLFGHSIGRWEGETLVIDTVAFEPNPWGLFARVPWSAGKHTVERLTLIEGCGRGMRPPWRIHISRSRLRSRCCGITGPTLSSLSADEAYDDAIAQVS